MKESDIYVVIPRDLLAAGPYALAVYAALRSFADQEGTCWPSHAALAKRARVSEKKVRLVLDELRAAGWIDWEQRVRDDGGLSTNLYAVYGSQVGTGYRGGRGTTGGDGYGTTYRETNNHIELEPVSTKNSPAPTVPKGRTLRPAADPGFAEFWKTYPRRTGKGQAEKAWTAATRHTPPETIIAGAVRYAQDPNLPDEPRFVPHPATWLNGRRWEDDPEPARQTNVGRGMALVEKFRRMGE